MIDVLWLPTRDGDERAAALHRRHYSYHVYPRRPAVTAPGYRNRYLFVGPGEKLVLLTPDCRALFVWRRFHSRDGQLGVNCAVFRNEGAFDGQVRSSALILAAEAIAWQRWPGARLYTYVNPRAVRSSNPGCCFLKAGWRRCGVTKVHKLMVLEKAPLGGSRLITYKGWIRRRAQQLLGKRAGRRVAHLAALPLRRADRGARALQHRERQGRASADRRGAVRVLRPPRRRRHASGVAGAPAENAAPRPRWAACHEGGVWRGCRFRHLRL